jgi:hypothetical protein
MQILSYIFPRESKKRWRIRKVKTLVPHCCSLVLGATLTYSHSNHTPHIRTFLSPYRISFLSYPLPSLSYPYLHSHWDISYHLITHVRNDLSADSISFCSGYRAAMSSGTRLFLLDYGAGNVRSLANTLTELGYSYEWISSAEDFDKADVCLES